MENSETNETNHMGYLKAYGSELLEKLVAIASRRCGVYNTAGKPGGSFCS